MAQLTASSSQPQVVWCSASRTPQGFETYIKDMPWLALPFQDRQRFEALRAKYKVQSFPTLVFVEADTGRVISGSAREKVAADPNGDGFPYRSPLDQARRLAGGLFTTLVPKGLRESVKKRMADLLPGGARRAQGRGQ